MNKNILKITVLLSGLVLVLFAWKYFTPKEEIVLDQTNKTFMVKGDVRIRKAKNPSELLKMDPSTILEKGDIVETSEGSSADIIIGANTDKAIRLEEKSSVEFQGINPARLNMSKGKVRVSLKKLEPGTSFTVKTPTAISGARGTAWMQDAEGGKTRVCVFENNVYVCGLDQSGKPVTKEYVTGEGVQRTLEGGKAVSGPQPIPESDMKDWEYWKKNIVFLRDGKLLVDDFSRKDNYNNLNGPMGSWNIFYSDNNQFCKDEFTDSERVGESGYSLKLTYDVDSPFSAYNGFFTNLMGIDISEYKYLVFYIKGDKKAGFTDTINIELKNKNLVGRAMVKGITDEWKKMVVPLTDFVGISDFKSMKEFVIVFSDISVSKKEGVIYLDDIYFAKDAGQKN